MDKSLIAMVAHEINRAYCNAIGDTSQEPWENAPKWMRESAIRCVAMHLNHPDMTPERSHELWMADKLAQGWTYGEKKDARAKTHPCMVPYDQLPEAQRIKDYLFTAVVRVMKNVGNELTSSSNEGRNHELR